jgi:hypothetical protein
MHRASDDAQRQAVVARASLKLAGQIKPVLLLDYVIPAGRAMIAPHGANP